MKKVFVILFFISMTIPFGTILGDDTIQHWSDVKPLTWKDFKKDMTKSSHHKTHSAIGIALNPEGKDEQTMVANVYAGFDKEKSSKPDADGQTDEALHHEQTRFDLAEVYARKERKQLPDSTYKTMGKFQQIAQHINKQINKDFLDESAKYDSLTKFGADEEAQKKWDADITQRLSQLSDYTEDDKVELTIEKGIPKK